MKIDMFNHIVPKKFLERMTTLGGKGSNVVKRAREIPALTDLDPGTASAQAPHS